MVNPICLEQLVIPPAYQTFDRKDERSSSSSMILVFTRRVDVNKVNLFIWNFSIEEAGFLKFCMHCLQQKPVQHTSGYFTWPVRFGPLFHHILFRWILKRQQLKQCKQSYLIVKSTDAFSIWWRTSKKFRTITLVRFFNFIQIRK